MDAELRRLRGRLELETNFLSIVKQYGDVSYHVAEDDAWVYIPKFPIGDQWNNPTVSILIQIPAHSPCYPQLKPDSFWTDKDLRTRDGESIQHFFDERTHWVDQRFTAKGWGQFSFHLKEWHPELDPRKQFTQGDSLVSYLRAIAEVFSEEPQVIG